MSSCDVACQHELAARAVPHLGYRRCPITRYRQNTTYRDGFDFVISHNVAWEAYYRQRNVFAVSRHMYQRRWYELTTLRRR